MKATGELEDVSAVYRAGFVLRDRALEFEDPACDAPAAGGDALRSERVDATRRLRGRVPRAPRSRE